MQAKFYYNFEDKTKSHRYARSEDWPCRNPDFAGVAAVKNEKVFEPFGINRA